MRACVLTCTHPPTHSPHMYRYTRSHNVYIVRKGSCRFLSPFSLHLFQQLYQKDYHFPVYLLSNLKDRRRKNLAVNSGRLLRLQFSISNPETLSWINQLSWLMGCTTSFLVFLQFLLLGNIVDQVLSNLVLLELLSVHLSFILMNAF